VSQPFTVDGAPDPGRESAPLVVRTVRVEDPGALLALLPDDDAITAWVRRGEGVVGWGAAAVCRTSGRDRFAEASRWWAEHYRTAVVRDAVSEPGSGLVCFGSFAFGDDPGESVLVVPRVVVGRPPGSPRRAWARSPRRRGSRSQPILSPPAA
jgi:menaquinone-specific isochorismate synthase